MSWFDEQIKERINNDDIAFSQAFADMASVIMGKSVLDGDFDNGKKQVQDALEDILKYYHIPPQELPLNVKDLHDVLEFLLRPSGIMRRNVKLEGEWYKDGIGALLCETQDGTITALIPKSTSGYTYFDRAKNKKITVNRRNAKQFSPNAICFYKPFPLKELSSKDILKYMLGILSTGDYVSVAVATLAVSLMGLFNAYINNLIFSKVIYSNSMGVLIAAGVFMAGIIFSTTIIRVIKSIIMSRITTKLKVPIESATMMRILSLPTSFFKEYSSGNLASRAKSINNLCLLYTGIILSSGLTAIMSLMYIVQIFSYSKTLALPSILVLLITVLFSISCAHLQIKQSKKMMEAKAKEQGLVFSLISGIQKIKLAGAEKRAFAKWSSNYTEVLRAKYNPPKLLALSGALTAFISALGTALIYYLSVTNNVAMSEYMSFNAAYSMVMGAFLQFGGMALQIADLKPTLEMVEPIFKTVPEISQGKKVISRLSGAIELNHVSFRYSEDAPLVINDISLKIRPGQYVAIVGKTGCGKSTLMRLLLGFETPQKGAIYYDGNDILKLDLKSLRKNIGTVMQNGKLFSGDIYSNIVISAPQLTVDEAWEAAEMAGIADDIRAMPMQMNTIISEGSGGISGGQRQRLMIARAIAPKPKILIFDEATSALDNITQNIVTRSLDKLKCTRIVIAHRLSTIKDSDRILVIDKGKIIEDGTYDELIEKNGFFAELIERQRIDT